MDKVAFCLLVLSIISAVSANLDGALHAYDTLHASQFRHKIVKRDLHSGSPHVRQLQFDSLGRHFHLYLQKKKGLLSSTFKIVAIDADNNQREVGLEDSHPYEGYIIGETSSEVHAVWEDEDNLSASIHTKDDVIFVEPSWRHLPESKNYTMIVYRKSDVKMDEDVGKSFCGYIDANKDFKLGKFHEHDDGGNLYSDPQHSDTEPSYNDYRHAYQNYAKQMSKRPKRQVEETEEEYLETQPQALPLKNTPPHTTCQVKLVADYLFFVNMGKKSLSKTSSYLIGLLDRVDALYRKTDFGSGFVGMGFEIKEIHIHENYTKSKWGQPTHYNEQLKNPPWQTKLLLEAFSRDRSYRQFCLVHLFTYQAFTGGVLGLAYIGSPRAYSVGGICSPDYFKNRTRLYLNTGWSSSLNRHNRRLLTQEADLVTTHEFGHNWGSEHDPDTRECSPSAFSGGKYIMYTYSVSGYDTNNKIFSPCSKRHIVQVLLNKAQSCFSDKGKAFCGNSHVEEGEECDVGPEGGKGGDPCCNAKCQLKPGAKCSDMNDLCCKGCQYASNETVCHEQLDDVPTCEGVAHCTGTSAMCPPPAKKDNGVPCLQRGTCREGECIPLCEHKGFVSCICDKVETSCLWCCKKDHNSTCTPYIEDYSTNQTAELPDGMPCLQGSCFEGKCQRQTQDLVQRIWKIIENITPDQLVEFMKANIVGTVIILSLVIWIPVSCVVSWRDRKTLREERDVQGWLRADNQVLFRPQDSQRIRHGRSFNRQSHHGAQSFPGLKPLATNL